MKVEHYSRTAAELVEGVPGVTIRWVIGEKDEAPSFAMRIFEIEPGHSTPYHSTPYHQHDWEHEVLVLDGEGIVRQGGGELRIRDGSVIFVPGMEMHQFANRGESVLRFVCLVPI